MRHKILYFVTLLISIGSLSAQTYTINNSNPEGSREESCSGIMRQLISGGLGKIADIDNDGFEEIVNYSLLSWNPNSMYWYVQQYNPNSQSYEVEYLSDQIENARVTHLSLIDLDSDGNIEIVMELEASDVLVIDGSTKELKYTFKVPYPLYTSNRNLTGILKDDADNDGVNEIIMVSGDHCWLYMPSANGLVIKSDYPIGGNDVRIGNTDANPDNEIVFVDKVYRITGEDYELLWTIPDSWGYGKTELINIDEDQQKEIIYMQWGITAWNGDTHDSIYDIYIGSGKISIKDIDGDGQEEIFHDANHEIHCLNSSTGDEIWSFNNPGWEAQSLIGISDLDNDAAYEIYWVGDASFSGSVVYVYDLATQSMEWKSTDTDGPFVKVRIADVDNDNSPELLTLTASSENGYGQPVLTIFDALTNALEWQSPTDFFYFSEEGVDFCVDNIDNDDTTEIVVAGLRGRLFVVNGITKNLQVKKGFSDISNFYSLEIADADNDGNDEIITCDGRTAIILDPTTWNIEWRSSEYNNYGDYAYKTGIGNLNADATPEIIFLHSNVLTIFDGITHVANEIDRTDISSFSVFDKNDDGIQELYIGTLSGKIGMITSDSINWTGLETGMRINDLNVRNLLTAQGEEFIFMSDGRLWISTFNGKLQQTKRLSKTDSKNDCIEFSDYNDDGNVEIFAGTSYQVTEMGYDCYKCAAMDIILQANHHTCGQGDDGSVTAVVNNAMSPITYSWNYGMTTPTIEGLTAGIYSLIAMDSNGCEDIDSIEVEQQFLQAFIHSTRKGCTSNFPGEITTEIVNGKPPYSYLWNNGTTGSSLYDPPAGMYTVLITDANNCTRQLSAPMIKDSLIISTKVTPITCMDPGSIEITASGSPPYNYDWSNGFSSPFMDEPVPGNYIVTVTDQLDCSATKEIIFKPYTELGAVVTVYSDNPNTDEPDGAIKLEPFGGTPPYDIQWIMYPQPADPLYVTGLLPSEYYGFYIYDSAHCYFEDYVKVNSGISKRESKIYPNPAHDYIILDLSENFIQIQQATAEFYDVFGTKKLSVDLTSSITTVDLSSLGSGLYIVKVNIDGIETTYKIERVKHKKKQNS